MVMKRELLDGCFYLQMKHGGKDRRMMNAMRVTKDFPWELNIDYDRAVKNEDGSWNVLTDYGIKVAVPGKSYWMVYQRRGEEPIIDILDKGSPAYFDYNVCSESGIVMGTLSVIEDHI